MAEKSDSREEQMRGMEGKSPPEFSIAYEFAQTRRMVDILFEAPERQIYFMERFLYGLMGSTTFLLMNFTMSYYSRENLVILFVDQWQIFSYLSGAALLSGYGSLFALLVSSVRGRSGPIRLYFRGFFVLYLPWLLLSQWN